MGPVLADAKNYIKWRNISWLRCLDIAWYWVQAKEGSLFVFIFLFCFVLFTVQRRGKE